MQVVFDTKREITKTMDKTSALLMLKMIRLRDLYGGRGSAANRHENKKELLTIENHKNIQIMQHKRGGKRGVCTSLCGPDLPLVLWDASDSSARMLSNANRTETDIS